MNIKKNESKKKKYSYAHFHLSRNTSTCLLMEFVRVIFTQTKS